MASYIYFVLQNGDGEPCSSGRQVQELVFETARSLNKGKCNQYHSYRHGAVL
jgi:hypothetical protein